MKYFKNDILQNWYRRWFDKLDESPPESVWENISESLDLDDVWQGVSSALDHDANIHVQTFDATKKYSYASAYRYIATLALLFLIPAIPLPDRQSGAFLTIENPAVDLQADQENQISSIDNYKDLTKSTNEEVLVSSILATENLRNSQVESSLEKKADEPLKTINIQDADQKLRAEAKKELQVAEALTEKSFLFPVKANLLLQEAQWNMPQTEMTLRRLDNRMDEEHKKDRNTGKWQIGLILARNNTWLVNYETQNGLRSDQLNQTVYTFGSEFGISGSYLINQRQKLQMEWYFTSQAGQQYKDYIDARRVDRSLALQYTKLQLVYAIDLKQYARGPIPGLLGGVYASLLQNAEETLAGQNHNVTESYKSSDIGIMIGAGMRFKLNDRINVNPTIRSSYSLMNIYQGNENIPAAFMPSRNAKVGLHLNLFLEF